MKIKTNHVHDGQVKRAFKLYIHRESHFSLCVYPSREPLLTLRIRYRGGAAPPLYRIRNVQSWRLLFHLVLLFLVSSHLWRISASQMILNLHANHQQRWIFIILACITQTLGWVNVFSEVSDHLGPAGPSWCQSHNPTQAAEAITPTQAAEARTHCNDLGHKPYSHTGYPMSQSSWSRVSSQNLWVISNKFPCDQACNKGTTHTSTLHGNHFIPVMFLSRYTR